MSIKYQRQTIGVEKKLGFLYVPAQGQEYMPKKNGEFSILLQGEKKPIKLRYNADHKRVFGLAAWYNKFKVKAGTILDIELNGSLMKLSLASAAEQPDNESEESEKLVDISGLSSGIKGNIVEDRIKELILLYGQGLLNVYKPVVDNRGIDLIVMRNGVFMPIFIQVKSRFNAVQNGSLLIDVGDNTFTPHHSFYILGVAFNPETLEIEDKLLLVPSKDYAEDSNIMTAKGRTFRRLTVSMKDNTKAAGAKYFIRKSELVEKLMEKFEEMEKYLK
jgi:hypothetical protein